MRILPFGDTGLLAEVDTLDAVLALHGWLAATRSPGVVDIVPAARTVLVHVDPHILPLSAARQWLVSAQVSERTDAGSPGPRIDLPIVYDGEDLEEVASALGLSVDEVIARHSAAEWTVAFTGFAPGFGYLVSPDWPFDVPRLASPRTRVPAGAVGLAGEFSGAYPRETPGGWQLIGTTSAPLFDPAARVPVLLTPGARVRFTPTRAAAAAAAPALPTTTPPARRQLSPETVGVTRSLGAEMSSRGHEGEARGREGRGVPGGVGGGPAVRVVEPGLRATVQDLGRPGRLAEGIAVSGAADRAALRTANRLLGNREDAAAIEITMGGFRAVAQRDLWFAVTGAWGAIRLTPAPRTAAATPTPTDHATPTPVDPYTAHVWPAGAELHVDWFAHGTRAYLAVRGGIDAPAAVGSRSTDTLAGLGPAALAAGAELHTAAEIVGPIPPEDLHPWSGEDTGILLLDLAPGPRAEWFAPAAHAILFDAEWTVSDQADRVGIRLAGPALARVDARRDAELPSEGMLPGAIQVPPSGLPVILGPDGPVTGGYPVIAVVTDAGRSALAQARPGTRIRFRHARPAM